MSGWQDHFISGIETGKSTPQKDTWNIELGT